MQAAASSYIPNEGSMAKVKEEFLLGFLPSFGSALAFKATNANGELEFYGLTDPRPKRRRSGNAGAEQRRQQDFPFAQFWRMPTTTTTTLA